MRLASGLLVVVGGIAAATVARAQAPVPPWIGDIPLPSWVRAVSPRPGERGMPGDLVVFQAPDRGSGRRGVTVPGATLPLFAARRGMGCDARWFEVGPLAWVCGDDTTLIPEEPSAPPAPGEVGLGRAYYFVARQGTSAYSSLDDAEEGSPDRELEGGWAVAIVEQRSVGGEPWGLTSKGLWLSMRDLGAARPSAFHGETLAGAPLDLAWVVVDRAPVFPSPSAKAKSKDALARFQVVHVAEESAGFARVGDGQWVQSRDIGRPHLAPPPSDVAPAERWIDVELASQTLVAYEGDEPVYATLVSTGRGPQGSDSATPIGEHRIWVKLAASDMDNAERDDVDAHYSLEDVPYVQFFDHAVALHGTYWHHEFGHVKSHGCVNLSPLDARWLFAFTSPRLPVGWSAVYPSRVDAGTVVRVR